MNRFEIESSQSVKSPRTVKPLLPPLPDRSEEPDEKKFDEERCANIFIGIVVVTILGMAFFGTLIASIVIKLECNKSEPSESTIHDSFIPFFIGSVLLLMFLFGAVCYMPFGMFSDWRGSYWNRHPEPCCGWRVFVVIVWVACIGVTIVDAVYLKRMDDSHKALSSDADDIHRFCSEYDNQFKWSISLNIGIVFGDLIAIYIMAYFMG
jgi:UDP-N-acetylmuramyl pentapeptide phosphotransferase/UDP-N-acetylglucosamine-1-phosphate transferase